MAKKKTNIHLICNAHLDPVWLWQWQEGVAEAVSTFRTAAELCEQNQTFIFNHNEAILYKWIQQYEPELFRRIQKLVKAGRWNIMGGWYLQPDCNMPSGESFVRQILLGKNYFREHFGVDVTTAINFDPFGHTRGLVQILAKSGYKSYLFGRPDKRFCDLPAEDFKWVGYDGSEILATRFGHWYNTPLGKAKQVIAERIKGMPDKEVFIVLWGVGDHGGGPSKIDLSNVNQLIKERNDVNIRHSTPQAYFRDLQRYVKDLPRHKNDLNPWAVGCYTSQVRIKQRHRMLENELYSLEKMASAAALQDLIKYPYEQIQEALCDLMMAEFHDILPGSSIQQVEEDSLRMLEHGLEIVSRLKARAFFALSSGQKKAKAGEIPILVYNPHPFKTSQIVECEFNLPDFNLSGTFTQVYVYSKGKKLPAQVEKEQSNLRVDWRKRVVFEAQLEPSQMNRFDCRLRIIDKKPTGTLKAKAGKIVFKTKELEVVINNKTGLVDRYRVNGRDCLGEKAFEPIVIADNEDSWGMTVKNFRKVIGRFKLMDKESGTRFSGISSGTLDSVRIIEDGPVRSVIEAVFAYNNSFICRRYKLPKKGTEVEVETKVYWNEKDRMLKLSVPTVGRDCKYLGQVAYGVSELPCDGTEAVSQKWVAVVSKKDDIALTCINDGTYASDFSNDGLRLTLLRSPAYSSFPAEDTVVLLKQGRYIPRMDQGERLFRFWFNCGKVHERLERIDREALVKNEKPFALSLLASGRGKKPKPIAILGDDAVQITTIKRAERVPKRQKMGVWGPQNNNDLIIRLFEPTGKKRTTVLSLPCIKRKIRISLCGFEIKTLKINPSTGKCVEVNLLEKKLKRV